MDIQWIVRWTYMIGGETVQEQVSTDKLIKLLESYKNHNICVHSIVKV